MAEIVDLNVTDASNTQRFPEAMAPSTVNNGARALEGLIARFYNDLRFGQTATLSGSVIQVTSNQTSITLTGTTSNYRGDLLFGFVMGSNPIAGPASLNINGVGPISIRDNAGLSLTSSAIIAGSRVLVVMDAANNYFRKLLPEYATSSVGLLAANNLSDVSSAASSRTNLGLGTAATQATGTSGANVPLLNGANTHSGLNTFSAGFDLTPATTPSTTSGGYLGSPLNTQDATYTLLMTDCGKTVYHTSASTHTWTIPPNATTAFPIGSQIGLLNIGSGAVTVARGSGVSLRINSVSTDGNKTIPQYGYATLTKYATNDWLISGGVS